MRSFSFCCMPVHVIHIYKLCLLLKGFSRGNKEDIFTRNHKVFTGSPKCVKQWVWCIIMVTSSSVAWKIQHKEKTPWARHMIYHDNMIESWDVRQGGEGERLSSAEVVLQPYEYSLVFFWLTSYSCCAASHEVSRTYFMRNPFVRIFSSEKRS